MATFRYWWLIWRMWELWLPLALWGYLGYFFGIIDSLASFCHFWLIWLFCGINGYFQYYRQFWLFSGIGGDFGYFLFDCFLCSLTNLRFEIHSDLKYVDMKSPRKLLLHRRSKKFWCRSAKFWRSYAQIFLKCAAQSNFKMTEDRQRRRTKMKGKVLTFWKRWFSTVVELQSIWHVKSVVKCILLLFFTVFEGVSIFHFALYYAVFFLDQF